MKRRAGHLETIPMIGHIVSWAKIFLRQFSRSNELQEMEPDEISRISRDFGVSVSDLLTLAKSNRHVQELLTQRIVEMGISGKRLQDKHPKEFGDLYRVCANCASTKRCTNEFLQHKSGHSDYCPNTDTLEALRDK